MRGLVELDRSTRLAVARLVDRLAAHHLGRDRGVRGDDLAAALGISPRDLRHLVSHARQEGTAIVGTPSTGYYIAATADELDECCAFLRARALHSLRLESRLRNLALEDLLGQLRLNT